MILVTNIYVLNYTCGVRFQPKTEAKKMSVDFSCEQLMVGIRFENWTAVAARMFNSYICRITGV